MSNFGQLNAADKRDLSEAVDKIVRLNDYTAVAQLLTTATKIIEFCEQKEIELIARVVHRP